MVNPGSMSAQPNEERAVLRYQLRTQLESSKNELANLPQQRMAFAAQRAQTETMAQQTIRNAEAEKVGAEGELERLQEQQRVSLAQVEAQREGLEAQITTLESQLERPDERLTQPRQVLEQQLDQLRMQLSNIPAQRSNVEVNFGNQLQQPRDRLRNADQSIAQARGQMEQAEAQLAQQEASLEAREGQLKTQIESLEDQLTQLDAEEQQETGEQERERQRTRALEQRLSELDKKLEEMTALAEAQRDVTSASGATELAEAYSREADRHARGWKSWLGALIGAVVLAGGVGAAVIAIAHPARQATNGEIATSIAIQILVVGLSIYLVRMAGTQFRAHRHLEAVNRSKAAALATFNRIVSGPSESEVRTAVAAVLAQAVFTSEETGFIDGGADHVTLVERAIGPILQRLSGGG